MLLGEAGARRGRCGSSMQEAHRRLAMHESLIYDNERECRYMHVSWYSSETEKLFFNEVNLLNMHEVGICVEYW